MSTKKVGSRGSMEKSWKKKESEEEIGIGNQMLR